MSKRWYCCDIRVRYAETDQMGVVYHTNYLNWFEWGRTEMIRELGMSYRELESKGVLLPVTRAEIDFAKPARYDDRVRIYTAIEELSRLRIRFLYEVRRQDTSSPFMGNEPEGELLVTGRTEHVWVNREFRPVRLDREVPEAYRLLESIAEA